MDSLLIQQGEQNVIQIIESIFLVFHWSSVHILFKGIYPCLTDFSIATHFNVFRKMTKLRSLYLAY